MKYREHTIDAKNKSFGRVASNVAHILRGKNSPAFKPNAALPVKVKVINLGEIKLTGQKMQEKTYKRYSGYPGGLKTVSFKSLFTKTPRRCFRKAVAKMLPKNKLRKILVRNLVFE